MLVVVPAIVAPPRGREIDPGHEESSQAKEGGHTDLAVPCTPAMRACRLDPYQWTTIVQVFRHAIIGSDG